MVLEEGVGSQAAVENREVVDSAIRALRMIRWIHGFIVQKHVQGR